MKEHLKPLLLTLGILLTLAVIGGIFTSTRLLTMLTLALAVFLYFILPGYGVLLLLELDAVERILLAIPTSATLLPLMLYYANLFGLPLSRTTVLASIFFISAASLIVFLRSKTSLQKQQE